MRLAGNRLYSFFHILLFPPPRDSSARQRTDKKDRPHFPLFLPPTFFHQISRLPSPFSHRRGTAPPKGPCVARSPTLSLPRSLPPARGHRLPCSDLGGSRGPLLAGSEPSVGGPLTSKGLTTKAQKSFFRTAFFCLAFSSPFFSFFSYFSADPNHRNEQVELVYEYVMHGGTTRQLFVLPRFSGGGIMRNFSAIF